MGTLVVVRAVVAGSRDEQNSGLPCRAYRILERLRFHRRAPAGTDDSDIYPVLFAVDGVVYRLDRIIDRTKTAAAEELERHYLYVPIDARDALAVIALSTDNTGAMRAVAVVVHRIHRFGLPLSNASLTVSVRV